VNYEEPISATATTSNIGQAAAARADTAGVIAPPPLIYLGALGVGFALDAVIGGAWLPSAVARPVGAALIVTGAGLIGTFVRAFGRAQTPVDPYRPSEAIVSDGPYRLTRNPRLPRHGAHACRDRDRLECAIGARPAPGRDRGPRPRHHRA